MRLFEIARLDMTAALPFRLCAAGILGRGKAAEPGLDAACEIIMIDSTGGGHQHLAGTVMPVHEALKILAGKAANAVHRPKDRSAKRVAAV